MNLPPLVRLPPHADLFGWAARALVEGYRDRLPDLGFLTLILPTPAATTPLRRELLRAAGGPLLGPVITTLDAYIRTAATVTPLSALDGRLLLTELLNRHPDAFGTQDAAGMAADLFRLFEELSASCPALARDEAAFRARIERGFGAPLPSAGSREARVIHLLWQAYLQDTAGRSPAVFRLQCLKEALAARRAEERIVLIGFDHLTRGETALLKPALQQGGVSVVLQGPLHGRGADGIDALTRQLGEAVVIDCPAEGPTRALLAAFDTVGRPLSVHSEAGTVPEIRLLPAQDAEHEARCVDLAIREALLEGVQDIAVVTQDRRLARRLRALLERAGIPLRDEIGWALSTSAAAASLGHWLDCCEQNFPHRALLGLLKSAFYDDIATTELDALEAALRRERIAGGLDRLKQSERVPATLLLPLEQAMRLMMSPQAPARAGTEWSQALLRSLRALPLWQRWQHDEAGAGLIRALEELDAALSRQPLRCGWHEFRRLLETHIEHMTFMPPTPEPAVRLLTLEQAQGLRCERLILAGASESQFPGRSPVHAVFNHSVRAELGLPHWHETLDLQLSRFRRLLHAAPQLRISYAACEDQPEPLPCPWVQWLQTLGLASVDRPLPQRAASAACEIATAESTLPAPSSRPAPAMLAALLPDRLSARAHQMLVDCPYRFYASYGLGLNAWEDPDRPVDARDFGDRVHRILQAFHEQRPHLPPPFDAAVTAQNLDDVRQRLEQIAAAVFAQDMRQRALARVWAAQFRQMIPHIADWMLERQPQWPQVEVEQKRERLLVDGLRLHGTIDRLETGPERQHSVVDYKTGAAPDREDQLDGEAVQGTHYALLAEPCAAVEFFSLDPGRKSPRPLQGDELHGTMAGITQRLIAMHQAMSDGTAMPAHGDRQTCERCDHRGICRRDARHD